MNVGLIVYVMGHVCMAGALELIYLWFNVLCLVNSLNWYSSLTDYLGLAR